MKKILKLAQYFAVILVLTITFANFGNEKLEEFLKNLQKQEKKSIALFDKTRIAKAATAATCTVILETITCGLIQKNQGIIYNNQIFSILILIPFGCYLATDYLFDKITQSVETKKGQN